MAEKKYKRRFGDRSDGRRLRNIDPMARVACYIMNDRTGASNRVRIKVDMEPVDHYVREKKKEGYKQFNLMHVLISTYVRTIAEYPKLNRFIAGQEIFARNNIEVSMVIKKEMKLESPDTVIKFELSPEMTPVEIYEVVQNEIDNYRNEPGGDFDDFARVFNRLPGPLMRFAMRLIRMFDYLGLLPKKLMKLSPFHCSMFLTNLGSLGIPAIYHHLYDFGNCPIFMAFGKREHVNELGNDGEVLHKTYSEFTVMLDERITDGYYFASALRRMEKLLRNPKLLDERIEEVKEDGN